MTTTLKNISIALAILLYSGLAQAQFLNGKILDANNSEPIAFATIYLPALETGTTSSINGHFNFTTQLPAPIELEISAIGFKTKHLLITKQDNKEAKIVILLEPTHLELDEIVIQSKSKTIEKYAIANVESVSLGNANMAQAQIMGSIANIPSVYNQSTGVGIGKPVIRGLSGMRVVSFLNGLRIENQQWGGDHGLGITSNGIGEVKVIKGPSALLYGADALGGVLHFKDEPFASQNEIDVILSTKIESNTQGIENKAGIKISKENFRISLLGQQLNHADYKLPDGSFAKNARFRNEAIKLTLGYHKKNWISNLRYNYLGGRIGIPGHSHDSIINTNTFRTSTQERKRTIPAQTIANHYLSFDNRLYLGKSDIKLTLGYTSNQLTEYDEKWTVAGIDMRLQNYSYNAIYNLNINEQYKLVLGAQGMFQSNNNNPGALEDLIPNSNTLDNGIYALLNANNKWLKWQMGFRADIRTLETQQSQTGEAPFNGQYNGYNYSLGAIKELGNYEFRTNISTGFRPPHSSELLADGVHHGNLRYEIGNIELQSEQATQLDVSAAYKGEHFDFTVNPYINKISNYIQLSPTDKLQNGLPVFEYEQLAMATFRGADFKIHWHPHMLHNLHIANNFSYLRATDANGNSLPLVPQTRFNTQLKWQFEIDRKFSIENIMLQHMSFLEQKQVAQDESSSPFYQLIHLAANLHWSTKIPIDIQLGVRNLLNEQYIDHLSRLKNINLDAPGRNFFLSLKFNINTKIKS